MCGPWHPVCPTPGSNGIRCVCMSLGHLHPNTVSVPVAPWTARRWCLLRWSSGFAPSRLLIFARLPGVSPWTHARRPGAPPTSALFRQYIGSANDEQNSRKRRAGTMMVTTTRRTKSSRAVRPTGAWMLCRAQHRRRPSLFSLRAARAGRAARYEQRSCSARCRDFDSEARCL